MRLVYILYTYLYHPLRDLCILFEFRYKNVFSLPKNFGVEKYVVQIRLIIILYKINIYF